MLRVFRLELATLPSSTQSNQTVRSVREADIDIFVPVTKFSAPLEIWHFSRLRAYLSRRNWRRQFEHGQRIETGL